MKRLAKGLLLATVALLLLASYAVAPTQSGISLTTSHDCYVSGDSVAFTLANGSDSVFWVNHTPVWSIRD
ncbi:MAG TPA: hypothetical protein VMU02_09985, partial [bacterium]|nr:hypothetical protein [bacterium]